MDCIVDTGFNFVECYGSVLLNSELYCYFESGAFTKISNINTFKTKKSLATPSHHGYNTALTGYSPNKASFIFKTGGYKNLITMATVEVYSVDRDEWSHCQKLNRARRGHSSCILGDKLYVSGGINNDTIEVAECSNLINGSATW